MLYVKQLRNALKGIPDDTIVYLLDEFTESENEECATLKSIELAEDGIYLYADIEEDEDDEEADCEKCSFEEPEGSS